MKKETMTAEALKDLILNERKKGLTWVQVGDALEAKKIRTPYGKKWTHSNLRMHILRGDSTAVKSERDGYTSLLKSILALDTSAEMKIKFIESAIGSH